MFKLQLKLLPQRFDIYQVWGGKVSIIVHWVLLHRKVKFLDHCALLPHEQMLHICVQYMQL